MEEDIKGAIERLSKAQNDIWYATLYSQEEQDEDIKLLIKGYRELEIKSSALENQNKYWKSVANDSIPKSKAKEKIEELETKLEVFEKDIRYCKDRVELRLMNDEIYVLRRCRDLLQELLESEE